MKQEIYMSFDSHIKTYKKMKENDISLIRKYFVPMEFTKGELLVKEGDVCSEVYFVSEGFFQVYILNDIEERTTHLAGPGDFVSAFSSFLEQKPSYEMVKAITNGSVLSISYEKLQELYNRSTEWDQLGRMIMERLFVEKQNRVISFIKHSAKQRYANVLVSKPEFLQNVPQYVLASYLGIKPETLSRIRSEIY